MSELRSEINRILNSYLAPVPLENALMRAIDEERDRWLNRERSTVTIHPERTGADQGISRLALISFAAGEQSDQWNTSGDARWVRYRGHHVDRVETPDGPRLEVVFESALGTRLGYFTVPPVGSDTARLLDVLDALDDLLDTVIEHQGVPGAEADLEVVGVVDSATALRVLEAWQRWLPAAVARGLSLPALPAGFAAAIDGGEVTP